MTKIALALSLLAAADLALAAGVEARLPGVPLPGVIVQAARGIDKARALAERDVRDCSLLKDITPDLAYIGVGLAVERTEQTRADYAGMSAAATKALGGCLTADRLADAQGYVKSQLEKAGEHLLSLVRNLYGD